MLARVPTRATWIYFEWHPDYQADMILVDGGRYLWTDNSEFFEACMDSYVLPHFS